LDELDGLVTLPFWLLDKLDELDKIQLTNWILSHVTFSELDKVDRLVTLSLLPNWMDWMNWMKKPTRTGLTFEAMTSGWNLPGPQSWHTPGPVAPQAVEYRPPPQGVQSNSHESLPVPYVPGRHCWHCVRKMSVSCR